MPSFPGCQRLSNRLPLVAGKSVTSGYRFRLALSTTISHQEHEKNDQDCKYPPHQLFTVVSLPPVAKSWGNSSRFWFAVLVNLGRFLRLCSGTVCPLFLNRLCLDFKTSFSIGVFLFFFSLALLFILHTKQLLLYQDKSAMQIKKFTEDSNMYPKDGCK